MSRRIYGDKSVFQGYLKRRGKPTPREAAPVAQPTPVLATGETAAPPTLAGQYVDRLMKLIPGEIIAAYVAATAMIASASHVPSSVPWIVFGSLLILTPIVYWKLTKTKGEAPAVTQISVSTAAFAVWVFALGGPFAQLSWYQTVYGGILLTFFTIFVPLFITPDAPKPHAPARPRAAPA